MCSCSFLCQRYTLSFFPTFLLLSKIINLIGRMLLKKVMQCCVQICQRRNVCVCCSFYILTISMSFYQSAPHFTVDGKLKELLKVTPGACLQYAVIEGNQTFYLVLYKGLQNFFLCCKSHNSYSHHCLCIYVIGTVKSEKEPLASHFHKEIFGVLQKFTLKEHKLVWSGVSRTW